MTILQNVITFIPSKIGCSSNLKSHVENYVTNGQKSLIAPKALQDNELYDSETDDYQTPDKWWKQEFLDKDPEDLTSDWVGAMTYRICLPSIL